MNDPSLFKTSCAITLHYRMCTICHLNWAEKTPWKVPQKSKKSSVVVVVVHCKKWFFGDVNIAVKKQGKKVISGKNKKIK